MAVMFEQALLDKLKTSKTLCDYVSAYAGQPSIFSDSAPEMVDFPYVVFRIQTKSTDTPALHSFSIFIDLFDYDKSRAKTRTAAETIEYLLDEKILTSERYDNIRCFYFSGGFTAEEDPRANHYNMQFSARAGRKKWANQL
jgi:hypothetical protein